MAICIYKLTTTVNDMVYIGCSTGRGTIERSLHVRWLGHKSESRSAREQHRPIYKAMVEYGIDTFSMEIVEVLDSIEGWNAKEQYWIDHYNSMYPNGYNLARACKKTRTEEPV